MKKLLVILYFVVSSYGQQIDTSKQSCEARAVQIAQALDRDNMLRWAIESGEKGDCVRQPWMDEMKQLGIKQVTFLVEVSWKEDKARFKIKSTDYLQTYYRFYDTDIIRNKTKLQEIEKSRLARKLQDVIIAKLKGSRFAIREKGSTSKDDFEANLLDDEALPVLHIIH